MARPAKPWYWKARDAWCVDLGGRRQILARGKAAKPQAMEEFHRLMVNVGRSVQAPPNRITVEDLFNVFLEDVYRAVERGERAQSTYDGYVRFLSSAVERIGPTRAAELTPHAVHAWCEATELKWNPTTRANAITAVKACFRWAKRRGLLRDDPIRDMEKPTPRRRHDILSPEKGKAVLDAAEGRFRNFLICLWQTGCRPGELATLEAANVDREAGILHVRDKIRRSTGKDTREVHATAAVMAIVVDACDRHADGPIFRNRLNHPWTRNAMACAMRRIRQKTGFGKEAVPYSFRHLYGTDALDTGIQAAIVAELMGHRGTRTLLERYAHLDERRATLRGAAHKIRPGRGDSGVPPTSGPEMPPDGQAGPA